MQHATIIAAGTEFHVASLGAGPTGAAAARMAGVLAHLGAGDAAAGRAVHADRAWISAASGRAASRMDPWGAADHARDMVALLDALGLGRVGVMPGTTWAAAVMQAVGRRMAPDRIAGLFFFGFVLSRHRRRAWPRRTG